MKVEPAHDALWAASYCFQGKDPEVMLVSAVNATAAIREAKFSLGISRSPYTIMSLRLMPGSDLALLQPEEKTA